MSMIKNILDKNFVDIQSSVNKMIGDSFLKRVEEKKKEIIDRINNKTCK